MSAGGPKQAVLCGCRILIFLFLILCGTIFHSMIVFAQSTCKIKKFFISRTTMLRFYTEAVPQLRPDLPDALQAQTQ